MQLFLSYSSADRIPVIAVQKLLQARGINTFLDRDDLVSGLAWPQALEQALRAVDGVAVFIGRELGGWQKREMWFALDRQVREEQEGCAFPVIPVLLQGADLTPGFLFLNTWIDLRRGLDGVFAAEALNAFERAIKATEPVRDYEDSAAQMAERAAAICPYRGLQVFREEDAAFFVGRKALAEQLLDFTLGKSLVAIVGPSGSGKSSVVQAGLLPLLRRERPPASTWDAVSFTPGHDPFHRLASALIPLLEPNLSETARLAEAEELGRNLAAGRTRVEAVINRVIERSNGTGRLLLVADQFEELFTLTAEPDRRPFAQALLRALRSAPVTALVTLRADFYSQIITLDRELSGVLASAQVNIGALTPDELRESITVPARLVGLEFESGLVDRILTEIGSEPGRLPLVEFALTEIWERRKGRLLTNGAYDEIGGVTGALARRAEAEFARLSPEEQTGAQRLFSRLVRVARPEEAGEDTRQSAELSEADTLAKRVAGRLADARLLVTGSKAGTGTVSVEVVHEVLIRNWERLRGWLNEDREFLLWRQRLNGLVTEWERAQETDEALLRGPLLIEAQKWFDQRSKDFSDEERKFISASRELRERLGREERERQERELESIRKLAETERQRADVESRARRRERYSVIVLFVLLLLVASIAAIAWRENGRHTELLWQASRSNCAQAQREVRAGHYDDAIAYFGSALQFRPDNTTAAEALLSVASNGRYRNLIRLFPCSGGLAQFSPDGSLIMTASSDAVCIWDTRTGRQLAVLKQEGRIYLMQFSPDGGRVFVCSAGLGSLWDAKTGEQLTVLKPPDYVTITSAQFSPNGSRLVTTGYTNARRGDPDDSARLWDAKTGEQLAVLKSVGGVYLARFSPDGSRIVTAGDGTCIWDAKTGEKLQARDEFATLGLQFSPDGSMVSTIVWDDTVNLWDAKSGKLLVNLKHKGVNSAQFSPDGSQVVTAGYDDDVARLWDTKTGKPLAILVHERGVTTGVNSAQFSPNGSLVVTAGSDNTARVWDAKTGKQLVILRHEGSVNSAQLSPDGKRVLTASEDQTAGLWDAAAGEELAVLKCEGHLGSRPFSPDGSRLLTSSADKTAGLWDTKTGKQVAVLKHEGGVNSVQFSPEGSRVLTTSQDHMVAGLWDAKTGEQVAVLNQEERIKLGRSLAEFSPEGSRVLTTWSGQTAGLWDTKAGKQVAVLKHEGDINSANLVRMGAEY
jgi:WD40 repeat protein